MTATEGAYRVRSVIGLCELGPDGFVNAFTAELDVQVTEGIVGIIQQRLINGEAGIQNVRGGVVRSFQREPDGTAILTLGLHRPITARNNDMPPFIAYTAAYNAGAQPPTRCRVDTGPHGLEACELTVHFDAAKLPRLPQRGLWRYDGRTTGLHLPTSLGRFDAEDESKGWLARYKAIDLLPQRYAGLSWHWA